MGEVKSWEKFCQNNPPPVNQFSVGHLVEARDSRARSKAQLMTSHSRWNTVNNPRVSLPAEFTLGKVVSIQGPRLCVHMLGTDDMHDQWFLCDSEDIRPHLPDSKQLPEPLSEADAKAISASADNKLRPDIVRRYIRSPLHPPQAFRGDPAHYKRFIARYDLKNTSAPVNLFKTPPKAPSSNLFQEGEKIEAVDLSYPAYICPATVREITGNYLRVGFDGWREGFDYWTRYDSRDIFPSGWCKFVGHELQSPGAHEQSMLRKNRTSAPLVADNVSSTSSGLYVAACDTTTSASSAAVVSKTKRSSSNADRSSLSGTESSQQPSAGKKRSVASLQHQPSSKSAKKSVSPRNSPKKVENQSPPNRTLRSRNAPDKSQLKTPRDVSLTDEEDFEEKVKRPLQLTTMNCVVAITPAKLPSLNVNNYIAPTKPTAPTSLELAATGKDHPPAKPPISKQPNENKKDDKASELESMENQHFPLSAKMPLPVALGEPHSQDPQAVVPPHLPLMTQVGIPNSWRIQSSDPPPQPAPFCGTSTVNGDVFASTKSHSPTELTHFILKDGSHLPNDPVCWSVTDVFRYLSDRDPALQQTALVLKDAEVDGIAFLLLKMCNMTKHLNLKLGPALKLNHMIEEISRYASDILPDLDFSQ